MGLASFSLNGNLPVKFISFDAWKKGAQAELTWSTASEQHNAGFHIQRGLDGSNFTNIGFVQASNNTTGATYSFTDEAPLKGFNFYRLQQVDADGKTSFGPVRFIDFSSRASLLLYPNPVTSQLNVDLQTPDMQNVLIRITNLQGQTISTHRYSQVPRRLQLDVHALNPGTYLLELQWQQERSSYLFMKK
jgi:hypothetical protein